MRVLIKTLMILTILLFAVDSSFAGGGVRTGTAGASELLIPIGARDIAMGGANVGVASGISSLFWNPAGIANMKNSVSVEFSHMNYIADIGMEYGAVAANFEGFGVVSLSIKALSIGDIPVTTNVQPDGTGETYRPTAMVTGLTYSRQLTDRIAIGVTANLISESIDQVSTTGMAFNAGVKYNNLANIDGLNFGIVLKNIGPQMTYDGSGLLTKAKVADYDRPDYYYKINAAPFELPSQFELGFGYKPMISDSKPLQFAVAYTNNNFSGDEYKFGAEYDYNNLFFLRGGYSMSPKSQSDEYIYGFTAGAGVNYSLGTIDVKVDYAYRYVKYFDANHVFEVSLGF